MVIRLIERALAHSRASPESSFDGAPQRLIAALDGFLSPCLAAGISRAIRAPPRGCAMLFVLSLCGYPIDGLTQSTVMAVQEVLRDNKFVIAGYTTVAMVLVLLVWACAAYRAIRTTSRLDHDLFLCSKSQLVGHHAELSNIAAVNTGGR